MKPNLSNNSYKNLRTQSTPVSKRVYPASAKVIHLAEHKLTRRLKPQEFQKSFYYMQRYKTKSKAKKGVLSLLKNFISQDSVIKWLFVSSTISSLIILFFFIEKSIIK